SFLISQVRRGCSWILNAVPDGSFVLDIAIARGSRVICMTLQSGNHASNSGICPTSTGNFTHALVQPPNRVISSIRILAIAPKLLSDFLIRREISCFNLGFLIASIFSNLQKVLSKPGTFCLEKHISTILSTFSSIDKSPASVLRKYRKSLCRRSLRKQ